MVNSDSRVRKPVGNKKTADTEDKMAKNLAVKAARAHKDMTQKELADAVGVSRQTINAIEKGEYNPTIRLCRAICRVLDRTLDELFWEEEEIE